jgi:hypothetical protein
MSVDELAPPEARIAAEYAAGLERYLAQPGELAPARAYELGRQAFQVATG